VHRGSTRLASLAITATLVIGLPGLAHAATGTFFYQAVGYGQRQINNPGRGCQNLAHGGRAVWNQTDSLVILFAQSYCTSGTTGHAITLGPGEESSWDFVFYSVWFDR
jgi:hypothetical protein